MHVHDCPELDVRLCRCVVAALHAAEQRCTIELVVARLSLDGADALELPATTLRVRGVQAPPIVLAATGEERLSIGFVDVRQGRSAPLNRSWYAGPKTA